jgi:hypothetical protein
MVGKTTRELINMEKGRKIKLKRFVAPWEISKGL